MSLFTFDEIWEKLRVADESVEVEAKKAEEVGKSVLETISAFANEPTRGGGYLLCGIVLNPSSLFPDYRIVGVPDPDKLQRDLATNCRDAFNVPIRPQLFVERSEGKTVVIAYIPEAQPHEKPVYIKSQGLPLGAYRRIGSTDQHCTDEDIAVFYQYRDHKTFDETVVPETTLDDIDPQAVAEYRRARAEVNPSAAELSYSDEELLHALAATSKRQGNVCATIAGLMLFGSQAAQRRHFPMARVDYILVEGREWVPNPDERYQTVEMREPMMTMIPRLVARVIGDVPTVFSLSDDGIYRRDAPLIPRTVIREAIVNALMHRSYRQRQPVQIIRYSNRIEIRNPGHSLKPDDRLGEPGSIARNEKIAAVMHEAGLAETKGSGIRAMREAMVSANLTVPFFESDREGDTFTATLVLHHLLGQEDVEWLAQFKDCNLSDDEARVLIVLREVGAMNNAYYRTLTGLDTLTVSRSLQRLRDLKLLEQKGKSSATYYTPGERFKASLSAMKSSDTPLLGMTDKSLPGESDLSDKSLSDRLRLLPEGFPTLPEAIRIQIETVGRRAVSEEFHAAVLVLCAWRNLQGTEIAALLGRNMRYVQGAYLSRMVRDGELVYTHPEHPAHPQQGYRITDRGHEWLKFYAERRELQKQSDKGDQT